jgi:hypothetical protein
MFTVIGRIESSIEGQETNGVQIYGEEFTQIALLHELLPGATGTRRNQLPARAGPLLHGGMRA